MFKRANVVVLPTNKKASIFIDTIEPGVLIFDKNYLESNIHWKDVPHYHLYITSDDKIEEGDWWLNKDANYNNIINDRSLAKLANNAPSCKKIIATTDTSIKIKSEQAGDNTWYNPYPKPSDSFISKYIEEYNKGNIITDVMVEYDEKQRFEANKSKRINPLNGIWYEYILKTNPKDNTITIRKIEDSWNREEIHILFKELVKGRECKAAFMCYTPTIIDVDKWLNDNL